MVIGSLLPAGHAAAEGTPLTLNLNSANQLEVRRVDAETYEFTTRGEDPYIYLRPFDPSAAPPDQTVLAFEYFSPAGVDGLSVFYGQAPNAHREVAAGSLPLAEGWLPHSLDLASLSAGEWGRDQNQLRLDFGRRPGVTLQVRGLHLRAPNAEELRSQEEREAERRRKLDREHVINAFYAFDGINNLLSFGRRDRIERVAVDEEQVVVEGVRSVLHDDDVLLELGPHISLADHMRLTHGSAVLEQHAGVRAHALPAKEGRFDVRLPRVDKTNDRTTARWVIARPLEGGGWRLCSHWKYATDLSAAAAHDLPKQTPRGIKGMGGVSPHLPLEELLELGVCNVTLNITLSGLLDTEPHPGWTSFEHGGITWHVNEPALERYDKVTRFAAGNSIVVSGILLVEFADSGFARLLIHPEADRAGHFAMPNLTTAEGAAAYEAAIACLAQRYAAPGAPHGRIANWIVHNEVGYSWQWTNMGRQPPMLYMDHYLRSMRLVHDVTRRHDPHSRVFISLTHHWDTPPDPSWKSYSNLALLNRLAESSRVEGDFAWGVAYHPYPQDLRNPAAWDDTQVSDGFDTTLITPKNIAVLDRWMQQESMLDSNGDVRGVLLSEQGFNTPDYSQRSQRLQAAAFVYMWRQMRGLRSIEAFHNHRWVDAAGEGGLLLGLRELPSDGRPFGDKKLAWETYRALDTPDEAAAARLADGVIGSE
ncbi:hypothetical protein KOR34_33080 [Posidoniimonas corsicana]|uniref:DUF5722 domain-containing protein n=1 Tax=Posidoniimonas corsicana TaxID=1938618 RepID=A0A5C5V4K8_9BACT|nr:DUF5722 domain-containing protein [Posidoniimonas corsicana]TWT33476.1 hypothetical protein KOR34_33080 [Posidoniimonas corsicana]